MGALIPARPTGLLTSRACPGEGRGLPASRNRPSEPSVSNHRPAPMAAFTPRPSPGQALTPQRHRLPPLPGVWASPLYRRLARRYGRIEFLIVRMARSPPVALHPASRRRSYNRLQAGVGIPGEDLHLPDQLRSQAHGTGLRRCGLQNKQRLTPTDPSNGRRQVKAAPRRRGHQAAPRCAPGRSADGPQSSSSRSAFACCRTGVAKPSVNQQ